MSELRTAKDVIVEYQFSMQEGSYGTNPAIIKAEFMSYTDLKLLFAEIDTLRAENAKLRETLENALSEYERMSDKYWDAIYPKPPSIEDYVIHKKTMRILREVLK